MKKYLLLSGKGVDQLRLVEEQTPIPSIGEVLIKVEYSGINFADLMMTYGLYPDAPTYPYTPGYELSGRILSVGDESLNHRIGDRVFAGVKFGGYASHIVLPSWQAMKTPQSLSDQNAAAFPVSFLTAQMALNELARIRKGDRVLIDCASGSLGAFCLQLIQARGAEAFGQTSSQEKRELLRERGWKIIEADSLDEKFHVILNSRGGQSISSDLKRLSPMGRVIVIGASSAISTDGPRWWNALKAFLPMGILWTPKLIDGNCAVMGLNLLKIFDHPEFLKLQMAELSQAVNDYQASVDQVFHYREATEALKFLEGKQSKGKLLLAWNQ
jgi:2-desacetyl-2-hydroxyethyl bacteriochlorophyllide A dehydrogenase